MLSPEFGTAKLKNVLRVGAAVFFASCSSALAPEVSATIDGHVLNVAGQASIVRQPNDIFLIIDEAGGLSSEDSISRAKRFMKNSGCNIVDFRVERSKGKTIAERVLVKFPCLPQLK